NIKEGRATRQNIQKQVVKVQRLHQRLANIRTDYINKPVFSIIKQKPSYITIEDLAVYNMMKNKHLYMYGGLTSEFKPLESHKKS
ncbi:TPA: transposase, partial [Clostridium perfringens]|nr:transposase [Clostridium perfringens]